MSELAKKITSFVADAEDWAKLKTSIPGLYVVKMPERKQIPAHGGLEINPADQFGNPTKRRGIYIRSAAEMAQVAAVFGAKVPDSVIGLCTAVFGKAGSPVLTTDEVLEIPA